MASGEWYYARGSQQYGPVSANQLKALAESGVLGPDDLVWRAGMSDWVAARRIKGLFEGPSGASVSSGAAKSIGPGSASAAGSGARASQAAAPPPGSGPAEAAAASSLPMESAAPPPLAPASVSRPNVAAPSPSSPSGPGEAAPLADTPSPPPPSGAARELPGRARVTFERSSAAFERSRLGQRPHLFDYLLDALGAAFSGRFTEGTGRLLVLLGHYGLYAGMLLILLLHGIAAVQAKSLAMLGSGLATVLALAALQYAAGRFSTALNRLDRSTTGQMVSTAVPDSLALFALLAGVSLLIAGSVAAVALHRFEGILIAVASFVVCQYAAMLALNVESLGISISRDTTVGQEAIGLITLLAKLGVRLSPAVITAGVLWGTVMLGYGVYLSVGRGSGEPHGLAGLGGAAVAPGSNHTLDDLLGSLGGVGGGGGSGNRELEGLAELTRVLGQGGLASGLLKVIGPLAVAASAEQVLLASAAFPLMAYAGFLAAYVLAEALRLLFRLERPEDEPKAEEKSQQ